MATIARSEERAAAAGSDILSFREKASYGFGDLAFSLSWNAVGAFLLYYYTNVALLPAAAIGTLFLLSRLFDAFVDLGVGIAVDKTRSRWGRTRPYFLFVTFPFCLLIALTFMSPNWPTQDRLVYAYVTFVLLGVVFSMLTIPYSALMPMMTRDPKERIQLGSSRSVGTSVSVIIATAATMPLVALFGHGDEKRGFAVVGTLFAVVSLIFSINLFVTCRERHYDDSPQNFAVLPAVRDMLRNRAWLVTSSFALLNFIRFGAVLSVTAFFAIEVMKRPWMISVLLPSVSGTLLLGAFIAPPILKRTGIRTGCIGALALAILLYLILPFSEGYPVLFLALFLTASIIISVTLTAIFAMAADCVDYHDWKFGSRNEGLLSSGFSLAIKLGLAFGTAAIAYCLAWAGYDPKVLTVRAHDTIRWCYYGSAIAVMVMQIICISFWPMDRLGGRIRAELTQRGARPQRTADDSCVQ